MQRALSITLTLAIGAFASATTASACDRGCNCGSYGYRADAVYGYYAAAPP